MYHVHMKNCECGAEISVYSRFCKPCQAERVRERDKNRKRQMRQDGDAYAKVRENQNAQREIKRRWICDYLSENPCVDCGEADILVLEFDHRGDVPKLKDVVTMLNSTYSLRMLQEEVAKCDVRCANCHKRKTYERFGETYRTKYLASVSALPPK